MIGFAVAACWGDGMFLYNAWYVAAWSMEIG
jgi:hypothetical protein